MEIVNQIKRQIGKLWIHTDMNKDFFHSILSDSLQNIPSEIEKYAEGQMMDFSEWIAKNSIYFNHSTDKWRFSQDPKELTTIELVDFYKSLKK